MILIDKTVVMVIQKRHERPDCLMVTKLSVSRQARDQLGMKDCANPIDVENQTLIELIVDAVFAFLQGRR